LFSLILLKFKKLNLEPQALRTKFCISWSNSL